MVHFITRFFYETESIRTKDPAGHLVANEGIGACLNLIRHVQSLAQGGCWDYKGQLQNFTRRPRKLSSPILDSFRMAPFPSGVPASSAGAQCSPSRPSDRPRKVRTPILDVDPRDRIPAGQPAMGYAAVPSHLRTGVGLALPVAATPGPGGRAAYSVPPLAVLHLQEPQFSALSRGRWNRGYQARAWTRGEPRFGPWQHGNPH